MVVLPFRGTERRGHTTPSPRGGPGTYGGGGASPLALQGWRSGVKIQVWWEKAMGKFGGRGGGRAGGAASLRGADLPRERPGTRREAGVAKAGPSRFLPPLRAALHPQRQAAVHSTGAGTSPYLDITPSILARSGGPPTLTMVPTSRKYCAPMSGVRTISARASPWCGLLN